MMTRHTFTLARTAVRLLFTFMLVMGALPFALSAHGTASAQAAISLNEIIVSTEGTDLEFFEIAGAASTSLSGVTFLEIDLSGQIDDVVVLTGQTIPADGYWVASTTLAASTYGITPDLDFGNTMLTNNTNTYMLVSNFTGSDEQDLDTNDDGTLDILPWSSIIDSIAFTDGDAGDLTYSPVVMGPDGTSVPAGGYRCPNGTGTWNLGTYSPAASGTPGTANPCGDGDGGDGDGDVPVDEDTEPAPGPDMVPIPENAVVGAVITNTVVYYAPHPDAATGIVIEAGKTLWVYGMDASGAFYKVMLSGKLFWLPVETMGPNYDSVWNGWPLPTDVVE